MIITLTHSRSLPNPNMRDGYCNKGLRKFFKRHNMDWLEFRKNGLDESFFLATGDAMAIRLVEFARGR